MTKCRTTGLTLFLAFASGPALAQSTGTVTAEQMLERRRNTIPSVDEIDCPRGKDEIVICAKRGADRRYRLPLPVEPELGQIGPDDRFTTERLMALNEDERCVSNKGCARGLDFIGVGMMVAQSIVKALAD